MSEHLSLTSYAAACTCIERVQGGGSGAPPSAMSEGGGSGAPPSATSVGGGSGAPPSATSSGGGSGAPPSARIVAFSEQFPEVADPQAEPNTSTNPRHTSRIFPKCIVSSSEVHGARKEPSPKRETCVEPTLCPRFRSEGKEIWSAFQPKSDIPMDHALSRSMTTVERMRDLVRGNRHFVRVFHMGVVSRYRCALH